MATANSLKNEIQTRETAPVKKVPETIKDYVKRYEGEIAKALPKVMTPERFSRMVLTAITQTPKLAQCSPQSFVAAMLNAAQLGLEPNTPLGQAYLIPYGNQCQFQIGYKGLIDLANRSGEIKNIEAHIVYKNDEFEFEYGLDSKLRHKPTMGEKGEAQWVYAVYRLVNGGYGFEVMSIDEVKLHGKKYSKTFNNGPWQTDFEAMAKKTVLKKVLKYAPMKSDFITNDECTMNMTQDDDGNINLIPEDDYNEIDDKRDALTVDENGEVKIDA